MQDSAAASLLSLAGALLAPTDESTLLQQSVHSVAALFQTDLAVIVLASPSGYQIGAGVGSPMLPPGGPPSPGLAAHTDLTLARGHLVSLWESAAPSDPFPAESPVQPPFSGISASLAHQGETFGCLLVYRATPQPFSAEEISQFEAATATIGIALHRSRLLAAATYRAEALEALLNISEVIGSAKGLSQILGMVSEALGNLLPVDGTMILLWDETQGRLMPTLTRQTRHILAQFTPEQRRALRTFQLQQEGLPLLRKLLEERRPLVLSERERASLLPGTLVEHFGLHALVIVPLVVRNQFLGVLAAYCLDQPRSFTQVEVEVATALGRQAALAIERVRLFKEEQRQRQLADTMREVSWSLSSTLHLEKTLQHLLEQLRRVIPFDSAAVLLHEEDHFLIKAAAGFADPGIVQNFRLPARGQAILEEIRATRRPLRLWDVRTDPRWVIFEGSMHIRGWLGVPLIAKDQVIGILTVDSIHPGAFNERDIELTVTFAHHAVHALENARLYRIEQQRTRELHALYIAASSLLADLNTIDMDGLLQRILQAAVEAVPAAQTGALLLTEPSGEIRIRALHGFHDQRAWGFTFTDLGSYSARAVREQQPALIADARGAAEIRYDGDLPEFLAIQSAIVAPLMLEGKAVGAISLDSFQRNAFTPADLNLLITLATTASSALRYTQLYAEWQTLARTDTVTGLLNRRFFQEGALAAIATATVQGTSLALIMLDLDRFKQVNDQYGHLVGDEVLTAMATRCQQALQPGDLFARYGGEEFSILLPETTEASAMATAEHLRQLVAELPFPTDVGPVAVTISLGVAMLDQPHMDFKGLIQRADKALYDAKAGGRNRVVLAKALGPPG